jgi:ABC-type oligopeptide transport system substrate-binding subunit
VVRRLGLSLLGLGAGVVLLVSAAFAGPQAESQRGGTLRLMWGAEPESLDPAVAIGSVGGWTLLYATCAKLFNAFPDAATGRTRIVPEVVRSHTVSADGRTYTFELKRTFRFAGRGEPVDAQSFADAFNRTAHPRMSSAAVRRGFFDEIAGIGAFQRGEANSISGVQVLGRYRLRVQLTRRAGDFVARLTMPFFCPLLPGTPVSRAPMVPPGSGPYFIAERIPQRRMVLERNRFYRGDRIANPDRIVWTIEPAHAERIRATERNENDFTPVFNYPDTVVDDLRDRYGLNRPGGRFLRFPTTASFLFAFNTRSPAFKGAGTAPLRKAINYAIDRTALAKSHGRLSAVRSDRMLPLALSENGRIYPIVRPAPRSAQKWLARAKQRPTTLTLYTASFGHTIANAQVFAANLKPLGIDVQIKVLSFQELLAKLIVKGEPWDVAWLPWTTWYADPAGFLLPLLSGTRYEKKIAAANKVTGTARAATWAKLEADLMRNDPPVAVYADSSALILLSRSFGCFRSIPLYDIDLAAACVRDRR